MGLCDFLLPDCFWVVDLSSIQWFSINLDMKINLSMLLFSFTKGGCSYKKEGLGSLTFGAVMVKPLENIGLPTFRAHTHTSGGAGGVRCNEGCEEGYGPREA